jgi:uncharacterized protein (TIGR00661 family)
MTKTGKTRVFISPLNWGMGHASRIIPVVDYFHTMGYEIILGGSGKSGTLLQSAFPFLPFITLPSFEITYSKKEVLFGFSVIRKMPAFLKTCFMEHRVLNQLISELQIDVVISDNRYGLFSAKAHCIIITHQISPVLPFLWRWAELPIFFMLKFMIRRFNECWVPDFKDREINLTGRLSHKFPLPANTRFIGPISRFSKLSDQVEFEKQTYDMVVVLSGPPPHSEIFADIILRQSLKSRKKILIISGFQDIAAFKYHSNVTVVKHLETTEFRKALLSAKMVICRAGYSAIMDLIALKRTGYIIPTPGQSEQQYLAKHLKNNPLFRCISQQYFDLDKLTVIPNGESADWLNQLHKMQKELAPLDQMIKARSITRNPVKNPRYI